MLLKPLKKVEKKVDKEIDVGKAKAVSLVKGDERYLKKILRKCIIIVKRYSIKYFNKTKGFLLKLFKKAHKEADVGKAINNLHKIKPYKKLEEIYHKNVYPKDYNELIKTNELFVKQYKKKYTDKFIALLFIIAVVGMSIFTLNPRFNPGLIIKEQPIIPTIQQSIEYLSPEPLIGVLGIILALLIITIVSIMKIKREK